MKGVDLAAVIGLFAYLNARAEGPTASFQGWSLIMVLAAAFVLTKALGIDVPATLRGLPGSVSTLALITLAAIGLGAGTGWLARWSLRLNLSPVRVGLIFFGTSLVLINLWALSHGLKET